MSAPARPTLVKRNANLADLAMTRKSLARARTDPAPAAVPCTTATIGAGHRASSRRLSGHAVKAKSSSGRISSSADDLVDVAARAEGPPFTAKDQHPLFNLVANSIAGSRRWR